MTYGKPGGSGSSAAQWAFWGYLYGDGEGHRHWKWFSPYRQTADRFGQGAAINRVPVRRQGAGSYHGLASMPILPDMRGRASDQIAAFLTGVIEGEGGKCDGKIMDDPDPSKIAYIASLLDQLHVPNMIKHGKDVSAVFVTRDGAAMIQSWPYAQTSRVPNPGCVRNPHG